MDAEDQAQLPHVRGGDVSASDFSGTPLIIFPGVRRLKTELAALSIDGARVSGAPKKFSNAEIFKHWLAIFFTMLEAKVFKSQLFRRWITLPRM